MAKAIPPPFPRQAVERFFAALSGPLGPSFPSSGCGYSVVDGLLYCERVDDLWFPGDPLLLDLDADYGPLVRDLRECRRLLRRELRQTISPCRKREIRLQRVILCAALSRFAPLAQAQADDDAGGEG